MVGYKDRSKSDDRRSEADERFSTADRLAKERYELIAKCRELLDRMIPNARNQGDLKRLVAEAQQKIVRLAAITDEYNANHKKPLPPDRVDRKIENGFASQLRDAVVDNLANNDPEFKKSYDEMNAGRAGASIVAGERISRILRDEYNIPFEAPITKVAKR